MRVDPTQAEATICATLIARPNLLDDIVLGHEDFYDTDFSLVFRTIQYLTERNKPVNSLTVMEKLAKRVDAEKLATACNAAFAVPWEIQDCARIIKDASARRKLVSAAHRMIELAETADAVDDDAMAEVEKAISEIGSTIESESAPVLIADIMTDYWTKLEERMEQKEQLIGVDTGFTMINTWLSGWRAGYLVVVGARPGMGKTAFMLQSASSGADESLAVLFSVEMLRDILVDRMMSAQSMVPLFGIMNGRVKDEERSLLTRALGELEQKTLYIDDNPYATVPYIRSRLRKIARKNPGKKLVVFVDYLQIVKTQRGRSRTEEIGQISTELKAIAKEIGCCIVALAQVNREVDKRTDKRPNLSDLRDSGQIEQDADVIMFLYRDEYYNPEAETRGVIELIVAKNRNGGTGTAKVGFTKEYQKFIEVDVEAK